MSKKNLLKRILGIVLAASMVFNAATIPVHADPVDDNGIAEELQIDEDADQGISVGDADEENDIIDDTATAEDEVVEDNAALESDLLNDEDLDESELEVDLENVFYRALTADEMDAKDALHSELGELSRAEAGEDYKEDEVFICCETEEEAEKVAEAYSEATGYKVTVDSFDYGVATLKIERSSNKPEYSTTNTVMSMVKFAADDTNNLPVVYPNVCNETCSIPKDNTPTINETFSDPYLKAGKTQYQWFHNMVNDKYIWEMDGYTDSIDNVTVAVIDTGIDYTNNQIAPALRIDSDGNKAAYGFWTDEINTITHVYPKENPGVGEEPDYAAAKDTNGHGTNVSGIIGEIANDEGGRGVAAGVGIMSVRVFSEKLDKGVKKQSAYTSDVIKALNFVVQKKGEKGDWNIKVVNMSIGSPVYVRAYDDAIRNCADNGILVVAAAGNERTNAPSYPAAYENAMSVAALNSDYEKAEFSNYGNLVEIAAPGGEIRYNPATGNAYFEQLYSTGFHNAVTGEDGVSAMQGTSQATPVVSAVAAMVFATNPDWDDDQVRQQLKNTAKPLNSKYAIGAGCVDAAAAVGLIPKLDAPHVIIGAEELQGFEAIVSPKTEVELVPQVSNCVVYYTLNGKNPNPDDMEGTGTVIYDGGKIPLGDSGKTTLKVINTIYGNTSEIGTYNFTIDSSKIYNIDITSTVPLSGTEENPYYEVAEGKKLSLTASLTPSNVKNKKIKWESSDSTVASVDAKGNVTAFAAGDVLITASATDADIPAEASVKVIVTPKAQQIEIDSLYDPIVINTGEKQDLSGAVNVYPAEASQAVTYKSSKPAIASVDQDGVITGKTSGKAVITVTAADGTGVKDTINVTVKTPVTSINLTDSKGLKMLASGQKLKPQVVFNDGESNPDNKNLIWSIDVTAPSGDKEEYITINPKDGTVSADSRWRSKGSATIKAVSAENSRVYGELTIDLYPVTTLIQPQTKYVGRYKYVYNVLNLYLNSPWELYSSIDDSSNYSFEVQPSSAYNRFKYTSSNPKIVSVNSDGYIYPRSVGKASVTVEALDGSKKKTTFTVNVRTSLDELKIKDEIGNNVIYPGKSIKYTLDETAGYDQNYVRVSIYEHGANGNQYYNNNNEYIAIDKNVVKANDSLKNLTDKETINLEVWYNESDLVQPTVATFPLEMYPAGTNSVVLDNGSAKTLDPGECYAIQAHTEAKGKICCPRLVYSSSNPKVATVNSDGLVRAIANGTAKITVKAGDGSGKSAIVNLTVSKKTESVNVKSKTDVNVVTQGKTLQLLAEVDSKAVNKKVIWSLEKPDDVKYGSINAKGQFKATAAVAGLSEPQKVTVKAMAADGGGAYGTFDVFAVPAISGFTSSDIPPMSRKGEVTSFVVKTNGNKIGDGFDITIKSSNPKVATVDYEPIGLEGSEMKFKVTATCLSAGTTDITVTANDGSGVTAKYKLGFTVPVTDIYITAKNDVYTPTPGKSVQLVANVNKDASNKSVEWSIDEAKSTGAGFIVHDGKGKITLSKIAAGDCEGKIVRVVATSNDSGKSACVDITLHSAVSGKVNVSGASANETLCLGSDIGDLTKTKVFPIGITDAADSTVGVTTDYSVVSSKPDIVGVDVTEGGIKIESTDKTGKAVVTVKAGDGASATKINVTVVNPVRSLTVSSKTGAYKAAEGTKLQMITTVNSNATNKAVAWSVDKSKIASVSNKGEVSIKNAELSEVQTLTVTATAIDGSKESAFRTIMVYPKSSGIKVFAFDSQKKPKTDNIINAGDHMIIAFIGSEAGYTVTYTTGAARAYYYDDAKFFTDNSFDRRTTAVSVYGMKAGKCTVTATANDGSGQKITYNVIIKQKN